MEDNNQRSVSMPTLRRLAAYHPYLHRIEVAGRDVVSCTRIAEHMGIEPTQVRKDIEATGIVGKPRVGYTVRALRLAIEAFLGWNNPASAFLVGAGNLGAAILGYEGFARKGLNIVAAFDIDPAKVGRKIHGKTIIPLDKLPDLARRMHIKIGVITTPADGAQTVANLLAAGGVRAIWNFAPTALNVPENMIVESVSLASSLAVLSNRLNQMLDTTSVIDADADDAKPGRV